MSDVSDCDWAGGDDSTSAECGYAEPGSALGDCDTGTGTKMGESCETSADCCVDERFRSLCWDAPTTEDPNGETSKMCVLCSEDTEPCGPHQPCCPGSTCVVVDEATGLGACSVFSRYCDELETPDAGNETFETKQAPLRVAA